MDDLKFVSAYSIEEIENNFKDVDFFEGVMNGLDEALAFEKKTSKIDTISRKRSIPEVNVADLRNRFGFTQRKFATILGVSARTVEAWEIGRSNPTPTAKKLMYLLNEDMSLVKKLQ